MNKQKNTKTKNSFLKFYSTYYSLFYYLFIIIILITIIYVSNLDYYAAYTIDYLINRDSYTFKEESQQKDNKIVDENYFLTDYLNYIRNKKLERLPLIESKPVPEILIENLTQENVAKISNHFTEPFVVRGLIKDFDCVKKWNLDYFEKEFGDVEVLSFSDDKNLAYSKTQSTKLKICKSDNNLCSMKEICESIKKGDPIYVNNISKLFTENEQARNELNLVKMDQIINEKFIKQKRKSDFLSQLFLGGKNTGTSLHSSSNINFFFNIKGEKRWGFISPKYTPFIKCQTSRKALFAVSEYDFFSESPDSPYLKIPRYETVLKSGDFLFNPAWYWHAVKNKSDYTIAVANRYMFEMFGEIPVITNHIFFSFLQIFSPQYYYKVLSKEDGVSAQEYHGHRIDQEIINNISNSDAL